MTQSIDLTTTRQEFSGWDGKGLCAYLNNKNRASDYQRISIGVEQLNADDLV